MEQDHKNKIEAILFTTGRFMGIEEISKLCGIGSIGFVREALQELKNEYQNKGSSLEILEENGKWKLNIKKQYSPLTHQLLTNTELDKPTQETLAIIAFKQPALQADVIKIRGNKAYDHIHALKEANFIVSEKFGRTRLLKLAQKFFDYFDIAESDLKSQMEETGRKVLTNPTAEEKKETQKEEPKQAPEQIPPEPFPKPDPKVPKNEETAQPTPSEEKKEEGAA